MEKYEKIKTILREKNIPFEKKHKKDDCTFETFESNDHIIVFTRYMPYIKKDNPITLFGDVPIIYKKYYSFFNVFDKEKNFIMSIPTSKMCEKPIFLDKNNFILLKKDSDTTNNYYHYKQIKGSFIPCTFFTYINKLELSNSNMLLTENKLYDFKKEFFIHIPNGFTLLYDRHQIDTLFELWNINNYNGLTNLLAKKLIDKNLFCLLKQISYCEENIGSRYDIIAFMDETGNIISDLFYKKDNEIISKKIDKSINEIFEELENECKEKVHNYLRKQKNNSLSDEIIKKLEL